MTCYLYEGVCGRENWKGEVEGLSGTTKTGRVISRKNIGSKYG